MEETNLFFPKHYLLLEIEHLELSITHFFETGIIKKDSYEYLNANMKMARAYIKAHVQLPEEPSYQDSERLWINYNRKRKQNRHRSTYLNLGQLPLPFPISIVGLNERLDALKPQNPVSTGPKFPHKIPSGTNWNNIIVKFLNDERIEIYVRKLKHITDYKEMAMIGKGDKPNEQWSFLRVLAKYNGEITIKDPDAKERYRKHKQLLSDTLKNYFSIDYDPFYPYHPSPEKSNHSYKIKLFLLPPPEKDTYNNQSDNENTDPLGIHDFLAEKAPQIIENL